MTRVHMTEDQFNAFWAIVSAIVLIPSMALWVKHHLERPSQREMWKLVDQQGRRRDREDRNGR